MKATYRFALKLPVEGVQYSNIEQAIEWEVEGDDIGEMLKDLEAKLEVWLNEQMESTGGQVKSVIQDLNARLEKAREAHIELSNKLKD